MCNKVTKLHRYISKIVSFAHVTYFIPSLCGIDQICLYLDRYQKNAAESWGLNRCFPSGYVFNTPMLAMTSLLLA
jgi:hypothetical protein